MLGLSVIYFMIFEIVWVDFWKRSCCWPICASSCHVLTSLVYKMTMMHDIIMNPIENASWMFEHELGWLSFAVWLFSFIFDPRLALVVFWTYVEFICFRLSTNASKTIQIWLSWIVYCANLCFVGVTHMLESLCLAQLVPLWLSVVSFWFNSDLYTNEFDFCRHFSCLSSLNLLALLF